jgi:hypothetical protein
LTVRIDSRLEQRKVTTMKTLLPVTWKVPAEIEARLGDSAGRQRAMFADGHLLLILHEPSPSSQRSRIARFFWREPNGSWSAHAKGGGAMSLKKHLAEFTDRVEALENQLQIASGADDYFRLIQAVAPLHRTSRNLHATLQQAREAIPDDRDIIVARDAAGEVERAAELLHGDAKNGLEFTVAHETEQQSQRTYEMAVSSHRLNLLAAIFFPIASLSSVFGMNLSNGLDAWQTPALFWGILGAGLISGLLLTLIVAKKPTPPPSFAERTKDGMR